MLSRDLEVTLNLAFKDARVKRHELMSVEHLLLALIDNEAAAEVLRACGAEIEKLRKELVEFLDATTPLYRKMKLSEKRSPPSDFSGYCNGRFSTFNPRGGKKSPVPVFSSLFLVNRKVTRFTF